MQGKPNGLKEKQKTMNLELKLFNLEYNQREKNQVQLHWDQGAMQWLSDIRQISRYDKKAREMLKIIPI